MPMRINLKKQTIQMCYFFSDYTPMEHDGIYCNITVFPGETTRKRCYSLCECCFCKRTLRLAWTINELLGSYNLVETDMLFSFADGFETNQKAKRGEITKTIAKVLQMHSIQKIRGV